MCAEVELVLVTIRVRPEHLGLLHQTLLATARGLDAAADGTTDHADEVRMRTVAGRVYVAVAA